ETGMRSLHHQFFGMRSSAEERKIRGDGEFEITHTNTDFLAFFGGLTLMRMSRAGTMLARRRLVRDRGKARNGTAKSAGRSCPPRGNNRAPARRVRSTRHLRCARGLRLRSPHAGPAAIGNAAAGRPGLPLQPRSAPAAPAAGADAVAALFPRGIVETRPSPHRH